MGYIGRCSPREYGFLAALVINGVSILAILVRNKVILRVGIIADFGQKLSKVFGKRALQPIKCF